LPEAGGNLLISSLIRYRIGCDARAVGEPDQASHRVNPLSSRISVVLASRLRPVSSSRRASVASNIVSSRSAKISRPLLSVGRWIIAGSGSSQATQPITFRKASLTPNCTPFLIEIRRTPGSRQASMIPTR